jgi:hypothetical protein
MSDPSRFWFPQEKGLTFGNGGMIKVDAWFPFGIVAGLEWIGGRHYLIQKAFWVPISVQGKSGAKLPLSHGNKLQIGSSRFRYEVPPMGDED